jgi:hypothetical protein
MQLCGTVELRYEMAVSVKADQSEFVLFHHIVLCK